MNKLFLYIAWFVALTSMIGSLFFSEIMQLPPCVLCWYQRIAMYPLVLIIGVAIMARNQSVRMYALPLAVVGLVVAIYHNLIYYGVVPESMTPCAEGVPCNAVQLELMGFVTIPLMGLAAFVVITLSLLFYKREES